MDIICKPRYNVIFWRNSDELLWKQAKLDELLQTHEKDSCMLEYWTTVHTTNGRELYSMFICDKCDEITATLDKEHDLTYCPHCGRRIIR